MIMNAKQHGDKVTVTKESLYNGYPDDNIHARKFLKVGEIYTIDSIRIGNWSTIIKLVELPKLRFNAVNFIDVPNDNDINDLAHHKLIDDKMIDELNNLPEPLSRTTTNTKPETIVEMVGILTLVEIQYTDDDGRTSAIKTACNNTMFVETHGTTHKVKSINSKQFNPPISKFTDLKRPAESIKTTIKHNQCPYCGFNLNTNGECWNIFCVKCNIPS